MSSISPCPMRHIFVNFTIRYTVEGRVSRMAILFLKYNLKTTLAIPPKNTNYFDYTCAHVCVGNILHFIPQNVNFNKFSESILCNTRFQTFNVKTKEKIVFLFTIIEK